MLGNEVFVDNGCGPDICYAPLSKRFIVVYAKWSMYRYDIYGKIYDESLNPLTSDFVICQAVEDQFWPEVSTNGTNFFVVWWDSRRGDLNWKDIYGAVVSQDGTVEAEILVAYNVWRTSRPKVAFGDGKYFVVYNNRSGECSGVIYNSFGNIIKENFLIHSECQEIDIAYGSGFFVISGWKSTSPYGMLIELASDGTVIKTYTGLDWDASQSAIAYGLDRFVVVGFPPYPYSELQNALRVFIFDSELNLLTVTNIISYDYPRQYVDITFGKNKFFVTWIDYIEGEPLALGTLLTVEGLYNKIIVFPTQPFSWGCVSVAFGNSMFVVSWEDYRDSLSRVYIRPCFVAPPQVPKIEVSWQMVDESDNLITPGDRVKFQITLENTADVDANDLILSLSSPSSDVWIAKFEEGKMGGAHPESYNLNLDIYLGSLSAHTSITTYIEVWAKAYSSQERPWSPFPGLKEELYRRDYSWIDDLPVLGLHDIIITVICNDVTLYTGKMTIDINFPDFSSFYTVQQLNDLKPFLQGSETSPDYPKVDTFHPDNQMIKNVAAKAVAFSFLQVNVDTYRLDGAADTPYQAIKNIYDWLGEYYAIGSDVQRWSDTEIVTNMMNKQFGDCSQISDLTISLCRSVKIPARKLFGAEMKKVGPIWVFTFISSEAHEWAEAYVNDRWVQVDRALRLFDNPLGVYYEHSIMFVHLHIPGLLQGGPWYCKFSDCSAFNTQRIIDYFIRHKDHFGDAEDNPNNYIP